MTHPNTIATRFAEKFYEDISAVGTLQIHASEEEVLAFFQAEVLAIADEVNNTQVTAATSNAAEINEYIRDAATLIRNKANEIV